MASKPMAFLFADLGITKSHSRPHCPNDNPFSEAQFKTLKYMPQFPDRFRSEQHAHQFCRVFPWYNESRRHSGIGYHTPADVHYGRGEIVRAQRAEVLAGAYAAHPERFVRQPPEPPLLPGPAWINEPQEVMASTNLIRTAWCLKGVGKFRRGEKRGDGPANSASQPEAEWRQGGAQDVASLAGREARRQRNAEAGIADRELSCWPNLTAGQA